MCFQRKTIVDLKIKEASFNRAGFYTLKTNGDECLGELIVEEKPIEFSSGFSDLTVNCEEEAFFECEVSAEAGFQTYSFRLLLKILKTVIVQESQIS